jgi:CRISPR/Cas system-associated exonuclease Cas4 (RecB family)
VKFPYLYFSVYKTCPLQYKWKFVQRPDIFIPYEKKNAFIGILLAKLVEEFYRNHWWQEPEVTQRMLDRIPLLASSITTAENIKWWPDEKEGWITVANETVPAIIRIIKEEQLIGNPAKDPKDENLVEFETEWPLEGDELQMRPDLIVRRSNLITLLDGKGGKTVGRYVDKDQLLFYSLAVEKLYNQLPHRMGFWWFRHARVVWYPVLRSEVDALLNRVLNAIRGVKEGKFEPTPSASCRLCDFRSICETGTKYINGKHIVAPVDIPSNFGEVEF